MGTIPKKRGNDCEGGYSPKPEKTRARVQTTGLSKAKVFHLASHQQLMCVSILWKRSPHSLQSLHLLPGIPGRGPSKDSLSIHSMHTSGRKDLSMLMCSQVRTVKGHIKGKGKGKGEFRESTHQCRVSVITPLTHRSSPVQHTTVFKTSSELWHHLIQVQKKRNCYCYYLCDIHQLWERPLLFLNSAHPLMNLCTKKATSENWRSLEVIETECLVTTSSNLSQWKE